MGAGHRSSTARSGAGPTTRCPTMRTVPPPRRRPGPNTRRPTARERPVALAAGGNVQGCAGAARWGSAPSPRPTGGQHLVTARGQGCARSRHCGWGRTRPWWTGGSRPTGRARRQPGRGARRTRGSCSWCLDGGHQAGRLLRGCRGRDESGVARGQLVGQLGAQTLLNQRFRQTGGINAGSRPHIR